MTWDKGFQITNNKVSKQFYHYSLIFRSNTYNAQESLKFFAEIRSQNILHNI